MLSEGRLEELRQKYGKIGLVEFNQHVIVFRKPTRLDAREYRRKKDSEAEKMDAMDQLAQATIIAFDSQDDPNAARTTFTERFLEDYPLAVSNVRFMNVLSALSGIVEEEETKDLGKGASVRDAPQSTSPKV